MNNRENLAKLLDFIFSTAWDDLDISIQTQAQKCFLDLAGVICAGAKNNSAKRAASYTGRYFSRSDDATSTILSTGEKTSIIGAALANGMAANALDMDDGYSLLRGHPGSGFFGALLTAAEYSDCTYGEFLSAMVVAYEVSIRQGFSIRDFYKWDHSTGCYSAFGTVAGVGKLLTLTNDQLESALSTADFIAPLNPAKRSCFVPSMNKDGVYFGQHAGMQAVMMSLSGITGKNPVILDDEYQRYIDDLGIKYYMMDLYFKFYSCCRWAQGAIRCVSELMYSNNIHPEEIEKIDIYSFGMSGTLYKGAPTNEDEAQYNIVYPVAAQAVFGDCGPMESSTTKMLDPRIKPMIDRIEFHHTPEYDKEFPAKRYSRAKITTKNGVVYEYGPCEPLGDRSIDVTINEVKVKIHKMNRMYATKETIDRLIDTIISTPKDIPFSIVLDVIKEIAVTNTHPEIVFI